MTPPGWPPQRSLPRLVAELPRYGIDPGQGHVAWVHKPVTIDLNGYQQSGYANDYQGITARDFVMAADITMVHL